MRLKRSFNARGKRGGARRALLFEPFKGRSLTLGSLAIFFVVVPMRLGLATYHCRAYLRATLLPAAASSQSADVRLNTLLPRCLWCCDTAHLSFPV